MTTATSPGRRLTTPNTSTDASHRLEMSHAALRATWTAIYVLTLTLSSWAQRRIRSLAVGAVVRILRSFLLRMTARASGEVGVAEEKRGADARHGVPHETLAQNAEAVGRGDPQVGGVIGQLLLN